MAWPFYWDSSSRCLFQRTISNQFKSIPAKTPANKSTSCTFFPVNNATIVDSVPDTAIPAPISVSDKHCISGKQNDFALVPQWRLKGHVWGQQETTAQQAEPTTFEEYISNLEDWDRHLFTSMIWGANLTAVDVADQASNQQTIPGGK
jgi:hypothetical protein